MIRKVGCSYDRRFPIDAKLIEAMSDKSRNLDPDGALSRRGFLSIGGAAGGLLGADALLPGFARSQEVPGATGIPTSLDGSSGPIDLTISEKSVRFGERTGTATTINGTVPGPLLRFRQGDDAILRVTNGLNEDTSIHWHGILLPNAMDGVPKVNFPGIPAGETFEYRYPIGQYGTYWYHSHSGLQEQLGVYGPLVIDPAEPEHFEYDRDYVVVLSDWTFENPYRLIAKLKKQPDYYNMQQRTVGDFFRDARRRGVFNTITDRLRWGGMRMSPTDISDVTGATYTYLMNGRAPGDAWTGVFTPGERVRLRFINASAASYFDVRIPGLDMNVVQVSGQHVKPVSTHEIRMAVAETYDVIVEPKGKQAFTIFAEAMDRSGFAMGTLATEEGLLADVPSRRSRPVLTMADMGMDHSSMAMDDGGEEEAVDEHAGHVMPSVTPDPPMQGMEGMDHAMPGEGDELMQPGGVPAAATHGPDDHGLGNASVADMAMSRLHEPGLGLGEDGWKVLTYADIEAVSPNHGLQPPDREIEIHLTGNMERFMWSMDGKKFSDADPIKLTHGERIRLTMVNDTMMNHPMHLHGMWMELENGASHSIPKVHTINVKPAERVSLLVNADALGPWAFHCHILYHMDMGMFRIVEVVSHDMMGADS